MLRLDWQNQTKVNIESSEIKQHLESVLGTLNTRADPTPTAASSALPPVTRPDTLSLEIVITDDKEIAKLNKQFRHQDNPTDVLSFESPDQGDLLGSIVISVETAAKQAKRANISLLDECRMLASHGFLHLLGFNHH